MKLSRLVGLISITTLASCDKKNDSIPVPSVELKSAPVPTPLPKPAILPVGEKEIFQVDESLINYDYSGNAKNENIYLQTHFKSNSGASWSIMTNHEKAQIENTTGRRIHDTGSIYGFYDDSQLVLIHNIIVKYIEWDKIAKSSSAPSFNKELPFDISSLLIDRELNPQLAKICFYWSNDPVAAESKQDFLGQRLGGITGEIPEKSGPQSKLQIILNSHDKIYGNNLSIEEVDEFKTCIEQIHYCRIRYSKLVSKRRQQVEEIRQNDEAIKAKFK